MTNPRTGQDAPSKRTEISDERKSGRAEFAKLLREFFTANRSRAVKYAAKWAGVWDVAPSQVSAWVDPLRVHSVITCGDLQTLAPDDRLAILRYWVERTEAELAPVEPLTDPRFVALSATVNAGEVAGEARAIMADERADEHELVRFEAKCEQGEQLFRRAKFATRAALAIVRGSR